MLLGLVRPRVGELEPRWEKGAEGGEAANDRAVFKARPQQNEAKTWWERAERRERSAAGADSRALVGRVALARVLGAILPRGRVESWEGSSKAPAPGGAQGGHDRAAVWARFWGSDGALKGRRGRGGQRPSSSESLPAKRGGEGCQGWGRGGKGAQREPMGGCARPGVLGAILGVGWSVEGEKGAKRPTTKQ